MLWDIILNALFPKSVAYSMNQEELKGIIERIQRETEQKLQLNNNTFDKKESEIVFIEDNLNEKSILTPQKLSKPICSSPINEFYTIEFDSIQQNTYDTCLSSTRSTCESTRTSHVLLKSSLPIETPLCFEDEATVAQNQNEDFIEDTDFPSINQIINQFQYKLSYSYFTFDSPDSNNNQTIDTNEPDQISHSDKNEGNQTFLEDSKLSSYRIKDQNEKEESKCDQKQISKNQCVWESDEDVLLDYLFGFCIVGVDEKDKLTSVDIAENCMKGGSILCKEQMIERVKKEYGNLRCQKEFLGRKFEIDSSVLRVLPSDQIKKILFLTRLVHAIQLIYGISDQEKLLRVASLFCLLDDKQVKKILSQFGITTKHALHYKALAQIIPNNALKSVLFATATTLIHSHHSDSNNYTSSLPLIRKILTQSDILQQPSDACRRAQITFDNLTILQEY